MTSHSLRSLRTCALGALLLVAPALATDSRVLAPGDPALTADMVSKTAGLIEWMLDVRLTPAQRREYEQILIRDWHDASERKGTLDMLRTADKVAAMGDDERARIRPALQKEVVKMLRAQSNDADNRWLLAVYDGAHSGEATASAPVAAMRVSASSPGDARAILGKWRSGSVSGIQYRSSTTGAYAPTSGSTFFYEFRPDGTYTNNGLMQVTTYNCTTALWAQETGRYRVQGDQFSLEPDKGVYKTTNSCAPSRNSEQSKTMGNRSYTFRLERTERGDQLVTNSPDGKSRPDYFRREQ